MLVFESASDSSGEADRLRRLPRSSASALLLVTLALLFAWTSHDPAEPAVYWLWATPVLAGGVLLWAARRRLVLSPLAQTLATLLSAFLLCAGSLPSGSALSVDLSAGGVRLALTPEHVALARAFVVGFASAVLVREILLRKSPLLPGKWLAFLVVCVCLALFEVLGVLAWAAHGLLGRPSVALAFEGPWEFLLVYAGAASALVALTRLHDEQMQEIWMAFTSALDWRRRA